MTNYAEEQLNEIEALQSIYSDEFEEIGSNPWCFRIAVQSENFTSSDSDKETAFVVVQFTLGSLYPDEPPDVELKSPRMVDEDQLVQISSTLSDTICENIGMVMIYTLVTAVQDCLNRIVDEKMQTTKEEKQRQTIVTSLDMLQEAVVSGTPVTRDTFAAWKDAFIKEQEQSNALRPDPSASKLTGRQLFQNDESLAKSDEAFIDDGVIHVNNGSNSIQEPAVKIDETLFQNFHDLQLEDDSD
ncbi:RWD domain-containing protein 1-like [Corticium candelabrum]|uniref:RWD domain-containing protein 1-like n=1 Tax=Corticium candelabrum TaxID=121492 RepID=UPI002E26C695|nr:RWD domain-containing protein 1-like [Corticium candelabrum]